jgi:tryptophanyl-tRNA synthetase
MSKEIILTGIRSNAELTLGNYLGAVLPMVELQQFKQKDYNLYFFIPDLHSFTTPVDHTKLYQQTIDHLKAFAAAGFDFSSPSTMIYRQSFIPAHSELFTILNNFAYVGELSRMTQYKDKSSKLDTVSSGLFTYPVLMASDILLYGAQWVPVGDDQKQHLEITRDLAMRFNNKFGDILIIPNDWSKQLAFSKRSAGVRIRSLSNPTQKMSKSVDDPRGTILLSDSPLEASKKIMSATTDDLATIDYNFETQPGISNLLLIESLLTKTSLEETVAAWRGNTSYGDFKKKVATSVSEFLTNYQAKLEQIDEAKVLAKLIQSEAVLNAKANETLLKVQKAVGLRK